MLGSHGSNWTFRKFKRYQSLWEEEVRRKITLLYHETPVMRFSPTAMIWLLSRSRLMSFYTQINGLSQMLLSGPDCG